MGEPIFAMIVPLGGSGPIDPGFGNRPIHHPGHPDHGLPSQPGHPGNRPPGSWGGPVDPGWGGGGYPHPGGGPIYHPGHPSHGLPSQPGHPSQQPIRDMIDNALPPGEEVEIDNELPEVPPEYSDKVIVAVKQPNEPWKVMAYDDNVSAGTPLPPTPTPKK